MCATVIVEPAGNPVRFATTVTFAPVMLLDASLVTSKVSVAVPDATDSAFVMAGTSFAGDNCAEKVILLGAVGVGAVSEPPQPTANEAKATAIKDARVIGSTPY